MLTSAVRSGPITRPSVSYSRPRQISRGKFARLRRATAGFTTSAFDGYGLRGHLPARPAPYASDPVFVHRFALLLRASFRPHLTVTPLRFAITSRPSRCEEDLHLLADKRYTKKGRPKTSLRTHPLLREV